MPVTIGGGLSFCGEELSAEQFQLLIRRTHAIVRSGADGIGAYRHANFWNGSAQSGNPKSQECYLFLLSLQERGWLPWLPLPKPHARGPHPDACGSGERSAICL